MLGLPLNPKLTDVVAALKAVDDRVSELESYVGHNDLRITALEERQAADAVGLAAHEAGAAQRQQEIDSMKARADRDQFLRNLRGRR